MACTLESLPDDILQEILKCLAQIGGCSALFALMMSSKTCFHLAVPFLYASPFKMIEESWPKLSPDFKRLNPGTRNNNQRNNRDNGTVSTLDPSIPSNVVNSAPLLLTSSGTDSTTTTVIADLLGISQVSTVSIDDNRSVLQGIANNINSTSTATNSLEFNSSSNNNAHYDPRVHHTFLENQSRAVEDQAQKKRDKQMWLVWLFINCIRVKSLSTTTFSISSCTSSPSSSPSSSIPEFLLADPAIGLNLTKFEPMMDYLSLYTHQDHFGIRYSVWKLFPSMDVAHEVELNLIQHCPETIRVLVLESVQLSDLKSDIVLRMKRLNGIRSRQEYFDSLGTVKFLKEHARGRLMDQEQQQHQPQQQQSQSSSSSSSPSFQDQQVQKNFAIQFLELASDLPKSIDGMVPEDIGDLMTCLPRLEQFEVNGFSSIPKGALEITLSTEYLKTLKVNCGSLSVDGIDEGLSVLSSPSSSPSSSSSSALHGSTIAKFLNRCRNLKHLQLRPVNQPDLLLWAVEERTEMMKAAAVTGRGGGGKEWSESRLDTETMLDSIKALQLSPTTSTTTTLPLLSPSSFSVLTPPPTKPLVHLETIELLGANSECIAQTISQAAFGFHSTLETISINSFSYESNLLGSSIQWSIPLPALRKLKMVGRSNLPFQLSSFQYCPSLKILDWAGYSGMQQCTRQDLKWLKKLKNSLQVLKLGHFVNLDDGLFQEIFDSSSFSSSSSLSLQQQQQEQPKPWSRLKVLRLAVGEPIPIVASSNTSGNPSLEHLTLSLPATLDFIGSGKEKTEQGGINTTTSSTTASPTKPQLTLEGIWKVVNSDLLYLQELNFVIRRQHLQTVGIILNRFVNERPDLKLGIYVYSHSI